MVDKDLRKLIKRLEAQGFEVRATKRNPHPKVYGPDGHLITTLASSPSDRRGIRNAIATLRRAGFDDKQ